MKLDARFYYMRNVSDILHKEYARIRCLTFWNIDFARLARWQVQDHFGPSPWGNGPKFCHPNWWDGSSQQRHQSPGHEHWYHYDGSFVGNGTYSKSMGEGFRLSWSKSIEDLYLYRVIERQCPSCCGQIDDLGNLWMKNNLCIISFS